MTLWGPRRSWPKTFSAAGRPGCPSRRWITRSILPHWEQFLWEHSTIIALSKSQNSTVKSLRWKEISGVSRLCMKQMWSDIFPSCLFADCKYYQHSLLTTVGICTCCAINSSKSSLIRNTLLQIFHIAQQPRHQTSLPGWWELLGEPICQRLLDPFGTSQLPCLGLFYFRLRTGFRLSRTVGISRLWQDRRDEHTRKSQDCACAMLLFADNWNYILFCIVSTRG